MVDKTTKERLEATRQRENRCFPGNGPSSAAPTPQEQLMQIETAKQNIIKRESGEKRWNTMAKRIDSTPKKDGFRMPGEFEPQEKIWMIWPERPDNWRDGAKPAQEAYANVAKAISEFEPVTMIASPPSMPTPATFCPRDPRGGNGQRRRLVPRLRPHLCEERQG